MNNDIAKDEILPTPEADAHGQAAMLLVESLIHGLIEKRLLSVAEAVEIVDTAMEVRVEAGTELGEPTQASSASITLLQNVSASLTFDIARPVPRGNPV